MSPFYPLAFSHLLGSISLYFSSGVFGCHSAVLFITSVRYSNRFTLCILQVSAIVQSMALRSAPLWLPKNNEFLLDRDMYRFIRSMALSKSFDNAIESRMLFIIILYFINSISIHKDHLPKFTFFFQFFSKSLGFFHTIGFFFLSSISVFVTLYFVPFTTGKIWKCDRCTIVVH